MQGFNMGRYVPPDEEGVTSGNKLAGKHPLGARARKLHTTGALVVRFEMPFAVWCDHCKPHPVIIGQGVRFNAEKTKVGNYYSTPIYTFRMKHTVCGGTIEIKTDPQNTAYVVTEGGRKRDFGEDKPLQPGEIAIKPYAATQDAAEKDPFSKLEDKMEDKTRAKTEASRILELKEARDKDWEDPYTKNQNLRRHFRQERKSLEKKDAAKEALKERASLSTDLELPDLTEEDRQLASKIEFGGDPIAKAERARRLEPMFPSTDARRKPVIGNKRPLRKADAAAAQKAAWKKDVLAKARADRNPFKGPDGDSDDPDYWSVKRPKTTKASTPLSRGKPPAKSVAVKAAATAKPDKASEAPAVAHKTQLVDYPSDSD
ncbi:hypothetical protein N7452_010186 [Penicillium brevicompactum]|uniref:Uncharacterized protein n=1 Tax=Penicillium brevicompactum TaxID=5074 RepID=A0A9W9UAZ3_PENBR|nr:hypothetical protein N7452_010186 [Penicillium brevicompactum]